MKTEMGTSAKVPTPETKEESQILNYTNYSSSLNKRKPPNQSFSGRWNQAAVNNYLERYLTLDLVPIPLKGKKPLVRWKQWEPKSLSHLKAYIKPGINWGLKTGANLSVIDFDTRESFIEFVVNNIKELPRGTPIVKTGRGYHIWFKPKESIRNQHLDGIDIKGEGGYVVAPPSIHANGTNYTFINSPNDEIPEIDLDKLDFAGKKPERQASGVSKKSSGSLWGVKPYFDWQNYRQGVSEGIRHTVMVMYIGYLIGHDYTKEEIEEIVIGWNAKNKPPLPEAEVRATIESCWSSWAKVVSINTLSSLDSVLIETKDYLELGQQIDSRSGDNSSKPDSAWVTEVESNPVLACGRKRRIARNGRKYVSVSFFCGRWDCPRCSKYFRQRWIDHIMKVTEQQEVYLLECSGSDWGASAPRNQ